jgi:peptide/nickel transport system substrate-binding protein
MKLGSATGAALLMVLAASNVRAEQALRIGVVGAWTGAQPNISQGPGAAAIGALAARGLTYYDGDIEMRCLLCETTPSTENGLVTPDRDPEGRVGQRVLFRLKAGLKWDDGAPLTAADFVEAWRLGREEANGYFWRSRLSDEIWSVSAVDDRTLEVRRRGVSCTPSDFRFAPIPTHLEGRRGPSDLASYRAASLHLKAPTNRGLYAGPYRVATVDPQAGNERVTLERNPHWPGTAPRYDRVEIVYRANVDALREAAEEGLVDLVPDIGATAAVSAAGKAPERLAAIVRPGRTLMQATLNLDDPRLRDARVRQALLLAVDRDELARLHSDMAAATRSFVTDRFPYFMDVLPTGSDAARAERLLEAAGWRRGTDGVRRRGDEALSFRLAVSRGHLDSAWVTRLIESWKAIGVRVTPEPFTGIGQLTGEAPPALAVFGYTLEGGGSIDFHVFDSASIPKLGEVRNGLNIFRWRNPAVDGLTAQLRENCAAPVVGSALRELQGHVATGLPLLPLFFMPEGHLVPRDLGSGYDGAKTQPVVFQEIETWR